MRRSFRRLHSQLQPDAVLFLGDLMDGARDTMDSDLFAKNKERFMETVFDTRNTAWNELPVVMDMDGSENEEEVHDEDWLCGDRRAEGVTNLKSFGKEQKDQENDTNGTDGDINVTGQFKQVTKVPLDSSERQAFRTAGKSLRLYVAGNHDYGFGDTLIRKAMVRYKQEFGSVNYEVHVGNHTLVVLDTLALSSSIPSIREESQEFLSKIGRGEHRDTHEMIALIDTVAHKSLSACQLNDYAQRVHLHQEFCSHMSPCTAPKQRTAAMLEKPSN